MPKRSSKRTKRSDKPADENQTAAAIVQQVIAESEADSGKNPAAVALGRMGGKKGGPARARKLSKSRRSEIARKAALKRWRSKKRRS